MVRIIWLKACGAVLELWTSAMIIQMTVDSGLLLIG